MAKINTKKKGAFLHEFTFSYARAYFEREERSKSKLPPRIPFGHSSFDLLCKTNKPQKREKHVEQKIRTRHVKRNRKTKKKKGKEKGTYEQRVKELRMQLCKRRVLAKKEKEKERWWNRREERKWWRKNECWKERKKRKWLEIRMVEKGREDECSFMAHVSV